MSDTIPVWPFPTSTRGYESDEPLDPPATDLRPRWRVEVANTCGLEDVLNRLDAEGYRVCEARILPVSTQNGLSYTIVAERGAR